MSSRSSTLVSCLNIAQPLAIAAIIAIPLALGYGVPTTEPLDEGEFVETGPPIMQVAHMLTDLDDGYAAKAVLSDSGESILVQSDATMPRSIAGRDVLVFHSDMFGQWRLIDADVGLLCPSLRE